MMSSMQEVVELQARAEQVNLAAQQCAPLNKSYKFLIANIDFQTTAAQVARFFGRCGNVNRVRLLPSQGGDNNKGGQQRRPLHRGYGFLFMLEEPSTSALERHVNSFSDNKIKMMGRGGVQVR